MRATPKNFKTTGKDESPSPLNSLECGNDQCSIQPWGGQIEAVIERLKGRRLPELKQPQGQTNAKQQ